MALPAVRSRKRRVQAGVRGVEGEPRLRPDEPPLIRAFHLFYFPSYARLSAAMSNFFIARNALVTAATRPGVSFVIISSIMVGETCQHRPYLSLSHPYCSAFGSAESFSSSNQFPPVFRRRSERCRFVKGPLFSLLYGHPAVVRVGLSRIRFAGGHPNRQRDAVRRAWSNRPQPAVDRWIKLGIAPERIESGKPQQNGRHERMHRTLKQDTAKPPKEVPGESPRPRVRSGCRGPDGSPSRRNTVQEKQLLHLRAVSRRKSRICRAGRW